MSSNGVGIDFFTSGSAGFTSFLVDGLNVVVNKTQAYMLRIDAVDGNWPGNPTMSVQNVCIEWTMDN